MASISVIIPTLDRDRELTETIVNLGRQTVVPAEVVIVDQSRHVSLTKALLAALRSLKADVRYLRCQEPGPGLAAARNLAIAASRGDWLVFLDDDIWFDERLIEGYERVVEEEASVALIGGRVNYEGWGRTYYDPRTLRDCFSMMEFENNYELARVRGLARITGGNFAVRRDVAIAVGGFDENFRSPARFGETDFAIRVCLAGHFCVYDPVPWVIDRYASSGGERTFSKAEVVRYGMLATCYFANRHFRPLSYRYWAFALRKVFRFYAFNRESLVRPWMVVANAVMCLRVLLVEARQLAKDGPRLRFTKDNSAVFLKHTVLDVGEQWSRLDRG